MKSLSYIAFRSAGVCLFSVFTVGAKAATITACVANMNGTARIVPSPSSCIAGVESAIQFNQTGPAGPQGVPGANGAQGPAGQAGATGAQGPAGATGLQGPAGTQGPKGDTGAQGASGAQGPAGAQGVKGDTGATGVQGPAGPVGATGPQGQTGATGATGTISSVAIYSSTTTYTQGQVVFCSTACAVNGSSYYLNAASATGVDPSRNNGSAAPYILIAQAGATGAQGTAGATGPQGPVGPQGPTGATGTVGTVTYTNSNATGSASVSGSALTINFPAAGTGTNLTTGFTYHYSTVNQGSAFFCPAEASSSSCATTYQSGNTVVGSAAANACTVKAFSMAGFNYTLPGADTIVYNLLKNGASSGMTCTLQVASGGHAFCSDTTHVFSVTAGDLLTVQEVSDTSSTPYVSVTSTVACQ